MAGGGNKITESSGNVFADLGLPDADDLLAQAGGPTKRKPKNNRACGSRFELEVVKFLCAGGLDARKRLMSGQIDGGGDIEIHQHWNECWNGEAKWKSLMPKWLIAALGDLKFVVFKQSRGESYVLLRLSDFRDLCQ